MSRDNGDVLLDQLLRELLGNDRPRDMTARVLTRATLYDRSRRQWWIGTGAAAAAMLILGVSLYLAWPREYPEPQETGVAAVEPGEQIERGTELETGDHKGTVELGGYVHVDVEPHTEFMIKGKRLQEELALNEGRIEAVVTKKEGTFDVMVGRVDVHVTGTKFSVDVEVDDKVNPPVKRVAVDVSEGNVRVTDTTGAVRSVGGEGNPSGLKLEIPLVRPAPPKTSEPATESASVIAATVPATAPATRPRTSESRPAERHPAETRSSATAAPGAATIGPAANTRGMPPLVANAKLTDGNSQGVVVERSGNYSLRSGDLIFDLPRPDNRANGIQYLPGDYVTVTWSKGVVMKVDPAKPPSGILNIGVPPAK